MPSVSTHTLDRSRPRQHIVSSIARSAGPIYHCVLGSAGVGKTTFVRSLLRDHQVIARYAYRRFYVACEDARSVDDVVTKICAQLGCMRRGRWRRLLPRPALLVLDGLDGLTTSARHSLALESFLSRCCRTQGLSLIVSRLLSVARAVRANACAGDNARTSETAQHTVDDAASAASWEPQPARG